MLTALAPAKVNLFLHVGPAKTNGRHDLDSLVMFAGAEIADVLTVTASDDLSLAITGEGARSLTAESDNLVLRAACALREAAGTKQGAALALDKRLPIAAGIGGGSADAAAALGLLTKLWQIEPLHALRIAPMLGGDVPVALGGQTAFMRGEGERVEAAPGLPSLHAVLVNPSVPCPTGAVFGAFDAAGHAPAFAECAPPTMCETAADLIDWLSHSRNDLVMPAISLQPVVADVLEALVTTPTARLTRMSGSGATCFALYETAQDAVVAASQLRTAHPKWWVRATVFGEAGVS